MRKKLLALALVLALTVSLCPVTLATSFIWPLDASHKTITSLFGERDRPIPGASTNHKAVDIAASYGDSVYAAAAGTVRIGNNACTHNYGKSKSCGCPGLGNYLYIDHGNGQTTIYGHLGSISVSNKQTVKQGDVIGKAGSTGTSTGCHLHFAMDVNGQRVDPLNYVNIPGTSSNTSSNTTNGPSTLKISPTTQPTKQLKGDPFYFKGKITSNYPIISATVTLKDTSGNVLQTKTIQPNTMSVDIATSGLDALKFGVLSPGMYIFHLKATDQSGYSDEWSAGFVVSEGTGAPINNVSITSDKQVYQIGDTITFTCTHSSGTDIGTFAIYGANDYFRNSSCGIWNGDVFTTTAKDIGEFTATLGITNGRETVKQSCIFKVIAAPTPTPTPTPTTGGHTLTINYHIDFELVFTDHSPDGIGNQSYIYTMPKTYQNRNFWYSTDVPSILVLDTEIWIPELPQNTVLDLYANSDNSIPDDFKNLDEPTPVTTPAPSVTESEKSGSYTVTFNYLDENNVVLNTEFEEVTEGSAVTHSLKRYVDYEVVDCYSRYYEKFGFNQDLHTIYIPAVYKNGSITLVHRPIPNRGLDGFHKVNTYYSGLFYDVSSSDWFDENVRRAYEFGLIKGVDATHFDPKSSMTVAQAITLAARLHSIYYTGSENFVQSGNNWYDVYVTYARNNGIIQGTSYNYNDPISRAAFAHILAKVFPVEALSVIESDIYFDDVKSTTPYRSDIYLLAQAGIIRGVANMFGTLDFEPDHSITRAQVAAIVTRMADPSLR